MAERIFINIAIRDGLSNVEIVRKLAGHDEPGDLSHSLVYSWKFQFFIEGEEV
jgi:hypothetical protein